ncbi:hypothetical protein LCGC14_0547250 [marine sediment metagenome]|uniref:Uncharacterized protein n=1 Tax=marine sediment metagenome TaxID=412755 RepID=A0A0F9UZ93_9ZZZZ
MSKSWILIEVTEIAGEKTFTALAGTEDKKCANRALAAMKLHKDETIKAGRDDLTIMRSTVVDNVDYSPAIDECLNPELEDNVAKILNLVDVGK